MFRWSFTLFIISVVFTFSNILKKSLKVVVCFKLALVEFHSFGLYHNIVNRNVCVFSCFVFVFVLHCLSNFILLFSGRNHWVYDGTRLLPGYPRKILPLYKGIPKNTKAAFHDKYDGITYFFKWDRFWRYKDRKQRIAGTKRGYPLSDEFEGAPANITAAFSDGNGG